MQGGRRSGLVYTVAAIALFALGLIAYTAATLGADLFRTLTQLRSTAWESPQWNINHTEIEYLRYMKALKQFDLATDAEFVPLVRTFDVLYSRLETIRQGSLARELREIPEFMENLSRLDDFLKRSAAILDAGEATARARVGDLVDLSETSYPAIRAMSRVTLHNWNVKTEERRVYLSNILSGLTISMSIGFVLLTLCLILLYRLLIVLERRRHDLEQARDRAVSGERAKARFLSVMSHEIRNPLNGLLGSLSLLEGTPMRADQARAVKNMETSGQMLLDLVNRVLDPNKEDGGLTSVTPRATHLPSLITAIAESMRDQAETKGLTYAVDTAGLADVWVMADPVLIAKVLENLVGNAVKFTTEGMVIVTAEACAGIGDELAVVLRVSDTGCGIEPNRLAGLFSAEETAETLPGPAVAFAGSGLGLGIVSGIVKAMGGHATVESTPGQGSTFTIDLRLPRTEAEHSEDAAPTDATVAKSSTPLHILAVEDVAVNLMVLEELLKREGHIVETATNGRAAVAACRERVFDLILMDISMPVMNGVDAVSAIRDGGLQPPETEIYALTAFALPEEIDSIRAAGFDRVLFKPINSEALRSGIDDVAAIEQRAPAA